MACQSLLSTWNGQDITCQPTHDNHHIVQIHPCLRMSNFRQGYKVDCQLCKDIGGHGEGLT